MSHRIISRKIYVEYLCGWYNSLVIDKKRGGSSYYKQEDICSVCMWMVQ